MCVCVSICVCVSVYVRARKFVGREEERGEKHLLSCARTTLRGEERGRLPDRYCSAACKVINTVERRDESHLSCTLKHASASCVSASALRMRFELIGKEDKDIFFNAVFDCVRRKRELSLVVSYYVYYLMRLTEFDIFDSLVI